MARTIASTIVISPILILLKTLFTKTLSLKISIKLAKVGFLGKKDGLIVTISGFVLNELEIITTNGPIRNTYNANTRTSEITAQTIFLDLFMVFGFMSLSFLAQSPDVKEKEYSAENYHYISVSGCLPKVS